MHGAKVKKNTIFAKKKKITPAYHSAAPSESEFLTQILSFTE
jgi:hypothetical protein